MDTEYVKCTACKCLRHIVDEYEVYKGTRRKTCVKCKEKRNKDKCPHGKRKQYCRECGGAGICKHDCIKSVCKECCGSAICVHGKRKAQCKECCGSAICAHDKFKTQCKECDGSAICQHGKQRQQCKRCDPQGHLRSIISVRIHNALKSEKSKHSIQYLGCNIDEFKEHIEKQFETGMNWDNFGKVWQIDHIVPIKYKQDGKTPTLDDTIERLHWTNTQPLFTEENIAKGNKFIGKVSEYDRTVKEMCLMSYVFDK
jgi:hypothetical protein